MDGTRSGQRTRAWLQACAGAVFGLFLARVALELIRRPLPVPMIAVLGLLAAVGGLALARWPARRDVSFWPALSLLVYVLWPRRDLLAALAVAVLTALVWLSCRGWLIRPREVGRRGEVIPLVADAGTFVAALAVYTVTAARDVLPADAGEFQLAAALLGVAHPPGYPLYTLLGHLFVRALPWGTAAYRLNLMSGLLGASTLVLVARATRHWAHRLGASPAIETAGGVASALALGTATTFWAQATIANIRTPTAFFTALALYALSRLGLASGSRQGDRALVLLGLALGFGLTHHPSLVFPGSFFVLYVLLTDPRLAMEPRRWWRPLLAGLAGLLPLAYLPIRGAMGAPLAPGGLNTVQGFLRHVLARGFAGDMFAFANPVDLPHRLALVRTLFSFQFSELLLAAALLGLLGLLWRDWKLFVLLAGSLTFHTLVTITYRAPQTVEYLIPAYPLVAVAIGLVPSVFLTSRLASSALPTVLRERERPAVIPGLLVATVLWAGIVNGWIHGPSFVELARETSARDTVEPLLETAPDGALILADWHWATPMWYLQQVEGFRPEVEVRYVYPQAGETYRETWLRRIQEADPGRLLLLTHFYEFPGYTTEPWEAGFLVRPRPVAEPAGPLRPLAVTFGAQVRVLGYRFPEAPFHPGEVAEFILAWQPTTVLERAPSLTLRLVDGVGRDRAQADQQLSTDVTPGEVRFERLALPLYPTLAPGQYQLTLASYRVTETGFELLPASDAEPAVAVTDLELAPLRGGLTWGGGGLSSIPFTLHRRAVPFAGGPTLVGVDYDRSVPDALRVYLRWRGPIAEAWVAHLRTADGGEVAVPLPSVPADACATVAADLPGSVAGPLWLSVADGQGGGLPAAGAWAWLVHEVRLPAPAPDARFVPLGDEMALIGVRAQPARAGETMTVDVQLVGLRPLTRDDHTSVRLVDESGRWLSSHDGQPGLGGVPTLKWIRGSRVVDRHLLDLPEDFAGGTVRATLLAYEWFRMTPLPPMDGRLGAAIPLGVWAQP
jgi:hypothetical protein